VQNKQNTFSFLADAEIGALVDAQTSGKGKGAWQ
jgi:hypothetical protein